MPPATGSSGGTSINSTAEGGAVSANINLELFKNFHLIANSYWSDGGGQKIFAHGSGRRDPPATQCNLAVYRRAAALRIGHGRRGMAGDAEDDVLSATTAAVYISKDASFACFWRARQQTTAATATRCGYGDTTGIAATAEAENRVDLRKARSASFRCSGRSPNYGTVQLITQYSYLSRVPVDRCAATLPR